MPKLTRISLIAVLLLLALLTLPFWLPGLQSTGQGSAQLQTTPVNESASLTTPDQPPTSQPSTPQSTGPTLPAVTLVDAGLNVRTQQFMHPPAIFRWDPARDAVDWRLETGPLTGAYMDDQGRIHLLEKDRLTILDANNGQVLSRTQLQDMPSNGVNAGQPFPIGRRGHRIYLRDHAQRDNLFAYDLQTGVFSEERWTLCDGGYPFDSFYLSQENAFVTFCIDFSHGLQGLLTRLSLEDGSSASVEVPALGEEEYMTGNGFALGPGHLAYVVDSDAGALVEIDLDAMQILRQASYRPASKATTWGQRAVSWLLDLAATPAQAKRWMSQPAVSPGGGFLVVDGGFGVGGGETTTAWLLDLETLAPAKQLELPRSPQAFHFPNENLLYILLQTNLPGASQVMALDLAQAQSLTLDLPTSGRVSRFLP